MREVVSQQETAKIGFTAATVLLLVGDRATLASQSWHGQPSAKWLVRVSVGSSAAVVRLALRLRTAPDGTGRGSFSKISGRLSWLLGIARRDCDGCQSDCVQEGIPLKFIQLAVSKSRACIRTAALCTGKGHVTPSRSTRRLEGRGGMPDCALRTCFVRRGDDFAKRPDRNGDCSIA